MGRYSGKAAVKVANESATVNLIAEQLKSIKKIDGDARKLQRKIEKQYRQGKPSFNFKIMTNQMTTVPIREVLEMMM